MKTGSRQITALVEILCLIIGIAGLVILFTGYGERKDQQNLVKRLKDEISADDGSGESQVEPDKLVEVCGPQAFGWLEIEACGISYPVMFKPGDSEFYLSHNMYGEESVSGVPFIAGEGGTNKNHLIIYGHHMSDGSVFNHLDYFKNQDFFNQKPVLKFSSQTVENGIYTPVAVVLTSVKESFDFYNYTDLRDPEKYQEYLKKVYDNALYKNESLGNTPLITLSTCSYHTDNGRLVVVFKKEI